jgi:predicted ArsR family transcriptional regulator
MRALAHPTRLALLELLAVEGSATATRCAELLDESPASCSFHLRQLEKYGYVEEAAGGTGRQRPWQLVPHGARFGDMPEGEAADIATRELTAVVAERETAGLLDWADRARTEPAEWREAHFFFATAIWLTPAELDEIGEAMVALVVDRFADRAADPSTRPEGSEPVRLSGFGYLRRHR